MKIVKLLFGVITMFSWILLHAENVVIQDDMISEKNMTSIDNNFEQVDTIYGKKVTANPQQLADTITNIVNVVENASNVVTQALESSEASVLSQQTINIVSNEELEKWKYVNTYFITNIQETNSSQKISKFIRDYAAFLSMPVVAIQALLSDSVLSSFKSLFLTSKENKATASSTHSSTTTPIVEVSSSESSTTSSVATAVNGTKRMGKRGMKYIVIPFVCGLITYKVFTLISEKISNKSLMCDVVLIKFVKDWEKHRAQTPDVLQTFFDHLKQEYLSNNGKLPTIDAMLAQKIVEVIVSSSTIFTLQ